MARLLPHPWALVVCFFIPAIAWGQCELQETDQFSASTPQFGAGFGGPVAVDGDLAVIAAPNEDPFGAVHVYRFDGIIWQWEARLAAGDPGDVKFGTDVGVAGDRIVVGATWAPGVNATGGQESGAAYVFRRDPDGWVQEAKLFAGSSERRTLGKFVATDGQRVVLPTVAAGFDLAYVFRRDSVTWALEATLQCDMQQQAITFRDADIEGESLVIGTFDGEAGICFSTGASRRISPLGEAAAYRLEGGAWVREQVLITTELAGVGLGTALSGDTVLLMGNEAFQDRWMGFVFRRGPDGWAQEATLHPAAQLASAVPWPGIALKGDWAVIGGPLEPEDNAKGEVYVFSRTGSAWTEVAQYSASDGVQGDQLGFPSTLATNGQQILAGVPKRDAADLTNSGAVYVFDHVDCNGTGIPDACANDCPAEDPLCGDCNENGIADGCDEDCDGNGVPDDCECVALNVPSGDAGWLGNRFIPVATPGSCQKSAGRVRMVSLHRPNPPNAPCCLGPDLSTMQAGPNCAEGPQGCLRWLGPAVSFGDLPDEPFPAADLQCTPYYQDWSAAPLLAVGGSIVLPSSLYEVQFIDQGCNPGDEQNYSPTISVGTRRWGDVVEPFQDPDAENPTQPDVLDVSAIVDKVKEMPDARSRGVTELVPNVIEPAGAVNVLEISAVVDAVKNAAYPLAGPTMCNP